MGFCRRTQIKSRRRLISRTEVYRGAVGGVESIDIGAGKGGAQWSPRSVYRSRVGRCRVVVDRVVMSRFDITAIEVGVIVAAITNSIGVSAQVRSKPPGHTARVVQGEHQVGRYPGGRQEQRKIGNHQGRPAAQRPQQRRDEDRAGVTQEGGYSR